MNGEMLYRGCVDIASQGGVSSLEDSYAAVLARRAAMEEERRQRAEQRRLARSVSTVRVTTTIISPIYQKHLRKKS